MITWSYWVTLHWLHQLDVIRRSPAKTLPRHEELSEILPKLFRVSGYILGMSWYQAIRIFSESYYLAIQTFSEFISTKADIFRQFLPDNGDFFRVHVNQSYYQILYTFQSSYKPILIFSKSYYQLYIFFTVLINHYWQLKQ